MLYEVWKQAVDWYDNSANAHMKNKEVALDAYISGYDEGFKKGLEEGRTIVGDDKSG